MCRALAEFKRASNTFKSQLDMEMRNLELEENAKKPVAPTIQPPEHTIGTDSAIPPRVDPGSFAASESATPLPGDPGTQSAADSGTPLPADSAAHIVADSATPPPPGTARTPGDETASKAADA